MGPITKELIDVLTELEKILFEQKEDQWHKWILGSKKRLLASDYSGIEKLLSAYGGMGSFNDLVVGYYQVNKITKQRKDYREANQNLDILRTKAWNLATKIKQYHKLEF